jgi:hypothetical protein
MLFTGRLVPWCVNMLPVWKTGSMAPEGVMGRYELRAGFNLRQVAAERAAKAFESAKGRSPHPAAAFGLGLLQNQR